MRTSGGFVGTFRGLLTKWLAAAASYEAAAEIFELGWLIAILKNALTRHHLYILGDDGEGPNLLQCIGRSSAGHALYVLKVTKCSCGGVSINWTRVCHCRYYARGAYCTLIA
ncbi:hypothetical protein EVAR_73916_1 [Eumeta japonica]|uniref:Uncharacterized protein n=1 Tax=Eumeta variegata TaxID=151549 RepID=A0A4C1SBS5_EUMVA|nr:hypothetical protein EVAR_73916_1 [Eumeta japonica]